MFASNLRNEFADVILGYSGITKNFLLNNSDISIPTLGCILRQSVQDFVSIVSIQADQSRQLGYAHKFGDKFMFQSYQFRQINPDLWVEVIYFAMKRSFNRINSGRSIPTNQDHDWQIVATWFQSYQFMQINPDRS